MKPLTTKEFIKKANEVHNYKYNYSKTVYTSNKKSVTITCPDHGDFEQRPTDHMRSGCKKCASQKLSKQYTISTEEFIQKAKNLHGNTYDYSKVQYTSSKKKVDILCNAHGNFSQTPKAHMQGQGCPKCGNITQYNRFSYSEWELAGNTSAYFVDFYLYVLIMTDDKNEKFVKIGKTFTSLSRRYAGCPYDYLLYNKVVGSAKAVSKLEYKIKSALIDKYTPNTPFQGSVTECYDIAFLQAIEDLIKEYTNE